MIDQPNITILTSTVADGNMSFRWGSREEVVENRTKFLSRHNLNLNDCVGMQVLDATELVLVDSSYTGRGMASGDDAIQADGLLTKEKGLALFLLTADCLPIVVFDPVKEAVALIHSGWKSTGQEIAKKTIHYFVENFKSNPQDLLVSIGPSIKPESYKFSDLIQKIQPSWHPYLHNFPDGTMGIDIAGYTQQQLVGEGVPESNISLSPVDTARNSRYFSHFRDARSGKQDAGRFATVVMLKNK